MKIAEALILKSDMESKVSSLQSRITQNLLVQEGEEVQENPEKLIEELKKVSKELSDLIGRIQRANASNMLLKDDGSSYDISIQEALVKKEGLIKLQNMLTYFAGESSPVDRYSRSEIKILATVDADELQSQADSLGKEARELDIDIQRTNWQVDL